MIYNATKKKKIIGNVKFCESIFSKMLGAMFQKKIDKAYIFPLGEELLYGASIHMMFVFTNMSVFWLNDEKVVVDKAFARPWRMYNPKERASWIIELPEIKYNDIDVGDYLKF